MSGVPEGRTRPETAAEGEDKLVLETTEAFQELMNSAPVFMWLGAADGSCTFLSRSWYERTGQSPNEALGWGWLTAIHADDRQVVADAFAKASADLSPYQVEYRLRDQAAGYRWVLDSAAPRLSAAGELIGYVGSIVDNEERKRAELAVERSERRSRVAAEAAGVGIWERDMVANRFTFSAEAREIFGFTDGEEVTQDLLSSALHPDDLSEVQRLSALALDPFVRSREPYRYRIIRRDNGAVRWVLAHGEAEFDDAAPPSPVRYIGTFQDITKQVEHETRLADSEARLRLAMDAGGLAVWELDTATDTVTASPELNALFGLQPDAIPSAEDLRARFAPGERERLKRLSAETFAGGETKVNVEVRLEFPDGAERWLLIQAQLAPSTGTASERVIGVAMDITEQKRAEERLATIARELQHRVKNSLTVVQVLASQSFRTGRTIEEGMASFSQRLSALAGTAEVVTGKGWSADLYELVQRATQPYRDDGSNPFIVSGERVLISSKDVTAIGMALHELSTNAVKYGALSVTGGQVHLSWEVGPEEIVIVWKEVGGPPVQTPSGRGFGTRLLVAGLFNSEDGKVNLDFAPGGVECRIRVRRRDSA